MIECQILGTNKVWNSDNYTRTTYLWWYVKYGIVYNVPITPLIHQIGLKSPETNNMSKYSEYVIFSYQTLKYPEIIWNQT